MKYADLLRSLSGFNGLSQSGRRIEVRQHDERHITYKESPDKLTITVPSLNETTVPDAQAHMIRSKLGEVVSQFLYSEGVHSTIEEWKCNDSPLGGIVRDVDTLRAGRKLSDQFKGIRSDMRRAASGELAQFSERLADVPGDLNDEGKSALGGYTAAEIAKALNHNVPLSEIEAVTSKLPPDVAAKVTKAIDDGVVGKCVSANTQDESIQAGKELFEYFFDRTAEEEIQQQQEKAEEGGDDGDEEGEGSGGEGDGQGEGAGAVAKALGKEQGDGDPDGEAQSSEWGRSEKDGTAEEGDTFSIGDDGYGTYYITPPHEMLANFHDYTTPANKRKRRRVQGQEDVLKNDGALLAAVRRLLQVRSETTYIGGQKRGKLQRSAIYKVGCPTVGNGDWNSRIYRKRIDSETLDTAVEVLIDFSGSMHGRKIKAAIESAVKLAACMDKVGIPIAVTAFSDNHDSKPQDALITGYFKDYDGPCRPQDMLDAMWYHQGEHMGSNPDCCGVYYAIERMSRRREKRKVLLVMSDGCPASIRRGDQSALLPSIVRDADKYGVECYGIGIMDDSVSRFYPEYTVLKNPGEITTCLTNVIKQKIV